MRLPELMAYMFGGMVNEYGKKFEAILIDAVNISTESYGHSPDADTLPPPPGGFPQEAYPSRGNLAMALGPPSGHKQDLPLALLFLPCVPCR